MYSWKKNPQITPEKKFYVREKNTFSPGETVKILNPLPKKFQLQPEKKYHFVPVKIPDYARKNINWCPRKLQTAWENLKKSGGEK